MIILDCEQGTPEWLEARAGIVTGSRFAEIITPTGKPTTGAKRTTYMNTLLSEWMVGAASETFQSDWMRRGTELEPEARDLYAMLKDVEPVQVGMVYKDEERLVSCSPDALIGDKGLWENKAPAPHTHVGYLLKDQMPSQYIPQVQGQLWVCERDWCDFQSYCPGMPPMIIRVGRDEDYIKSLEGEINKFVDEMLNKRGKLEALK